MVDNAAGLSSAIETIGSARAGFAVAVAETAVRHVVDPACACAFVDDTILNEPTVLVAGRGVVVDEMTGAVVRLSYWFEVAFVLQGLMLTARDVEVQAELREALSFVWSYEAADDALGTAAGGAPLTAVDCAKGGCAGEDVLIEEEDVARRFVYVVFPLEDVSGLVGDANVQQQRCVLIGLLDDAEVGDFPRPSVYVVILGHVPYDQNVQMTVHAVQSIPAGGLQKARAGDVPVQRFGPRVSESRCSGRVQIVGENGAVEVRSWSRWNIPLECTMTDTTKIGDVWALTAPLALVVLGVGDIAEGIG